MKFAASTASLLAVLTGVASAATTSSPSGSSATASESSAPASASSATTSATSAPASASSAPASASLSAMSTTTLTVPDLLANPTQYDISIVTITASTTIFTLKCGKDHLGNLRNSSCFTNYNPSVTLVGTTSYALNYSLTSGAVYLATCAINPQSASCKQTDLAVQSDGATVTTAMEAYSTPVIFGAATVTAGAEQIKKKSAASNVGVSLGALLGLSLLVVAALL